MSIYVDELSGNSSPPAEDIVAKGWTAAGSRADSSFALALGLISSVANIAIPFTAVASGFTPPAIGYTLSLPEAPTDPDVTFPALPDAPVLELDTINPVVPADAPEFSAEVPVTVKKTLFFRISSAVLTWTTTLRSVLFFATAVICSFKIPM